MKPLLSFYSWANRAGLLRSPRVQSFFSKAYFFYKACVEDPFTPLVRLRPDLFAGGNILDVGANIGYTAALFSKVLTPGFCVYAFEPEARNFEMLKRALAERHLAEKVVPWRAAIGDHEGSAELWLNPSHHADHRMVTPDFCGEPGFRRETQNVPVMRLDNFCAREIPQSPICFIKIDVQGYEESVCRGMSETLRKNSQALVGLEYYPYGIESLGFKAPDILHFFQDREYYVFSLTRRRGLEPAEYAGIPKSVGPKGYIDLLFSKSGTILDGTSR